MKIDVSYGWQKDSGIADSNSENNSLIQDHGDYDITQPVAILKLANSNSPGAVRELAVDPYDNDYWTKLPRQ